MADREKDEMADALAAMAGGHVPSEPESPSSGIPSESTVFSTPKKKVEAPLPPPAAAAEFRRARPVGPQSSPPPTPPPSAPSIAPASMPAIPPPLARIRPVGAPASSPARPSTPGAAQPPARQRPAGPERPMVPSISAPTPPPPPTAEPEYAEQAPQPVSDDEMLSSITDDDDEMIAPAPDASAFAHHPRVKKPQQAPMYATLAFRRTIIPILLTCGLMFPVIGIWTLVDKNSPLGAGGSLLPIVLLITGGILLGLGILNVLHVKHVIESAGKKAKR